MLRITLPDLSGIVLVYFLVFARVGGMVMLMPGVGERSVPARVRLAFALCLSLVMSPSVASHYPNTAPLTLIAAMILMIQEIIVGVLIGTMARMISSALSVAGVLIANQIGLAMSQTVDPTSANDQGTEIGNFLSMTALVILFATNLHYLVIGAINGSYHIMPPGAALPTDDMAELAMRFISSAFLLGFQLAAPFLVFGFVINLAFGVLSRLMPQLQIFFVVAPVNLLVGFSLLALFLGTMITLYLEFFSSQMGMLQ